MGRRQALGWLGAALCSIALVIAGGLVLSSVAVDRFLQASGSEQQGDGSPSEAATPAPGELTGVEHAVTAIIAMPGVATASTTTETGSAGGTGGARATPSPTPGSRSGDHAAAAATQTADPLSYDVSVIMNPDSTPAQSADVVFAMTQQLQNPRVNLELSAPAGDGHAESVIDYRNAFDTPVARSTVDSISRAVSVVAAVPGVGSVHVTVPYTWNLAAGDLDIQLAADDPRQRAMLKSALSHTALAGIEWSSSQ